LAEESKDHPPELHPYASFVAPLSIRFVDLIASLATNRALCQPNTHSTAHAFVFGGEKLKSLARPDHQNDYLRQPHTTPRLVFIKKS
jgi:hypothetical protein